MNKTLINILHIVASVLTVANFIYSIINIDISNNQTETTINNFSNFSVGFRATIAFILEISLASFFGYIIRLISDSIKVNYTRIIYLTIVVFISIWVTNFNSIHILTGTDNLNEWGHWISYIIFFILTLNKPSTLKPPEQNNKLLKLLSKSTSQ